MSDETFTKVWLVGVVVTALLIILVGALKGYV